MRASPSSTAHALWSHLRVDGVQVALAYLVRLLSRPFVRLSRQRVVQRVVRGIVHPILPAALRARLCAGDPGEAAAARFLKATGHRVLARNWRSPRDPRDEADLIVETPDRSTVVLVEVKRAAGDWDPLERVDARKRAVLWRLLGDLALLADASADRAERVPADEAAWPGRSREPSREQRCWHDRRLLRSLRSARLLRSDLIGVRGNGSTATVMRHLTSLQERPLRSEAADSPLRPPARRESSSRAPP